MARLKDVAQRAGLSITQVSRALNNHDDVSELTRARVHDIARALGYQPNLSARKLVSGRSGAVGLVVPRSPELTSDGHFMEVVVGLSACFSARAMQFFMHVADQDEPIVPVYQRLIGTRALDGFILIYPLENDPRTGFLLENGVPFVVHGRTNDYRKHAYFDIDNEAIFYEQTRHMLSLGHRNIVLINGESGHFYAEARRRGFERAMAEAGISDVANSVRFGPMTEAHGLVSAIAFLSTGNGAATAVLCGNLRIAKGVYEAVEAMGLSIPGDVSVFAHDDHLGKFQSSAVSPALSVTEAPFRQSWEYLADCLTKSIAGAPLEDLQVIGEHKMILRQSTGPAPNRSRTT